MSLITAFIFGLLSAAASTIVEASALSLSYFSDYTFATSPLAFIGDFSLITLLTFIGIAAVEETAKFIFLRQYAVRFYSNATIDRRKVWVSGTLFGLGFVAFEILLAFSGSFRLTAFFLGSILLVHITTCLAFASYLFRRGPYPPLLPPLFLYLSLVGFHTLCNVAIFFLG